MTLQHILISKINLTGGTQPRAQFSDALELEYAEALSNGVELPEVVVYFDGTWYWLADGFHRIGAHKTIGRKEVMADVRSGTRRDAVLYSVGANAQHGARRTHDDIKRAVRTMLDDMEWSKWSDNRIAQACKVHQQTVANHRRQMGASSEFRKIERNGAEYEMDTRRVGSKTECTPDRLEKMEFGEAGRPKTENDGMVVFEVRLEKELVQEVMRLAKSSGMSNAEFVTVALQDYLQRLPKRRKAG